MIKKMTNYRCDLLPTAINQGKNDQILQLLQTWRKSASLIGKEHWSSFYREGKINKWYDSSSKSAEFLGIGFGQMVNSQVLGILSSWLSNRQTDFKNIVQKSTPSNEQKHMLHIINRMKAWHKKEFILKDGNIISPEIMKLARKIFAQLCKRHRQPNLKNINMVIDQRGIKLTNAKSSKKFHLWARLSTLTKGKPIWIPLLSYEYFESREGERALSMQINATFDGEFKIGFLTNVTDALAQSRAEYVPEVESIALDLGLRNLFATDMGDLLGRDWMDKLLKMDARLTKYAVHRQKMGFKKIKNGKYRNYVQKMRGYISSEVNRILNHLVKTYKPAEIIVEHLNFQNPNLSKRMNRLLSWFGKSAIQQKLKDLNEKYGIEITECNSAYTSQECSCCGYVDKRNLQKQAAFACLWCGSTLHADVNAARVIKARRSVPELMNVWLHRNAILNRLTSQHIQRYTRFRVKPTDSRKSNSYFKKLISEVTLIGGSGFATASYE
jgi:putative transposase